MTKDELRQMIEDGFAAVSKAASTPPRQPELLVSPEVYDKALWILERDPTFRPFCAAQICIKYNEMQEAETNDNPKK